MSDSQTSRRERIYIIKDLMLKLAQYGELNQTSLMSYCGLNLRRHKSILDDMESNNLIARKEKSIGKKIIIVYKPTREGTEFSKSVLEPFEKAFPRSKARDIIKEKEEEEDKGKRKVEQEKRTNYQSQRIMLFI
jgi:predicted transcriptional regulator